MGPLDLPILIGTVSPVSHYLRLTRAFYFLVEFSGLPDT
jgi:hypothetical protein